MTIFCDENAHENICNMLDISLHQHCFKMEFGHNLCVATVCHRTTPGPLFTKKTPSNGYRDPHDKPKTI